MKTLFMEKMNDLKDLLRHELMDLASAEQQIIEALPSMIEKASNDQLKNALSDHLRVTRQQKDRLDKVQELLEEGPSKQEENPGLLSRLFKSNVKCAAMKGILEEGKKMMAEDMNPEVMDAAIIACAQKVEHYEITSYGTTRTWARELGLEQVARLLEETLNEEYHADDLLTMLAENSINLKAEGTKNKGKAAAQTASPATNMQSTQPSRERAGRRVEELEPVARKRSSGTVARSTSTPASGKSSPAAKSTSARTGNTSSRSLGSAAKTNAATKSTVSSRSASGKTTSARTASGGRGNNVASGRNKSR